MNAPVMEKKRKSVRLSKEELKALKAYRKKHSTSTEAAENIGIYYSVLDRVILVGSGSPETIEKIRKAIGSTNE